MRPGDESAAVMGVKLLIPDAPVLREGALKTDALLACELAEPTPLSKSPEAFSPSSWAAEGPSTSRDLMVLEFDFDTRVSGGKTTDLACARSVESAD